MIAPELVTDGELGLDLPDALDVEEADGPPKIKFVYELGRTIVCRFKNFEGLVYAGRLVKHSELINCWLTFWSNLNSFYCLRKNLTKYYY